MPALWRKLLAEGGKKAFPKKALLRSKLTVEQALDNACGGKERH